MEYILSTHMELLTSLSLFTVIRPLMVGAGRYVNRICMIACWEVLYNVFHLFCLTACTVDW